MTTFPFAKTATLIKRVRSALNVDGNDTYVDHFSPLKNVVTWPSTSSLVGQGLRIEMRTGDQATAVASLNAVVPPGTDITALDAMILDGITWEVEGDPSIYQSPWTGNDPGIVVRLVKVTG